MYCRALGALTAPCLLLGMLTACESPPIAMPQTDDASTACRAGTSTLDPSLVFLGEVLLSSTTLYPDVVSACASADGLSMRASLDIDGEAGWVSVSALSEGDHALGAELSDQVEELDVNLGLASFDQHDFDSGRVSFFYADDNLLGLLTGGALDSETGTTAQISVNWEVPN